MQNSARCSTLQLETWSSCRLRCSSSRLFCSKATCWIFTTSKTFKQSTVTTFYGRSRQRDCVCQQPCTSRPPIHLCVTTTQVISRCPVEPPFFIERVSLLVVLHRAFCPDTLFVPRIAFMRFPGASRSPPSPQDRRLCLLCSSLLPVLVLSILFVTIHRIVISAQHQAAVAVCEQVMTLSASLRGSLRMYKLQP